MFIKKVIRLILSKIYKKWSHPNVSLFSTCYKINQISKSTKVQHFCEIGSKSTVGEFSYINVGTTIGAAVIGNFCSIGKNCFIGGGNHALSYISTSQRLYGKGNLFNELIEFEEFDSIVEIGSDVWIGPNSVVLQKANIGTGAVIASGSVVTKPVPPYAIVAGNPAKIIRYRFSEEKVKKLLESKWWDLDLIELKKMKMSFAAKEDWFSNLVNR